MVDSKQWQYRRPRPKRFDHPRRGSKSTVALVTRAAVNRRVPQEVQRFLKLFEHWETLVGARMSSRSCPALVKRHVLFVDLRDHQWAHDMRYMQKTILSNIERLLGEGQVLGMRCQVKASGNFVSHAQRKAQAQNRRLAWREMCWPAQRPPSLAPQAPDQTQATIQSVQDPALRDQAKALRSALAHANLGSGDKPG